VGQQHDVGLLAYDHARPVSVAELSVEVEAKLAEKILSLSAGLGPAG
jgi:hypothetical protein